MNEAFWPIVFLAMGLLLLTLELFVPSGGFIGFSAVVCLGLGLWNAFQSSRRLGITFLMVDFVAVPTTAIVAFRLWVRSPMGRRLSLAPPEPEEIDVSHRDRRVRDLVGADGRALTPLHPCGHVEIQGRRYDGMAESGLIAEGDRVRVIRVRSGQVVVRTIEVPGSADRTSTSEDPAPSPPRVDVGAGT
ncbi:NfeD family protein [Paludisphaera soli]|uniref:NfeD family protein n=1 Tax=Paludisphaera soli TaxID=2712865 RepID=UPI0013ECFD83|nr:NfeD family protein [Paludisphaera soli]